MLVGEGNLINNEKYSKKVSMFWMDRHHWTIILLNCLKNIFCGASFSKWFKGMSRCGAICNPNGIKRTEGSPHGLLFHYFKHWWNIYRIVDLLSEIGYKPIISIGFLEWICEIKNCDKVSKCKTNDCIWFKIYEVCSNLTCILVLNSIK